MQTASSVLHQHQDKVQESAQVNMQKENHRELCVCVGDVTNVCTRTTKYYPAS
jgi:hypothetical protein